MSISYKLDEKTGNMYYEIYYGRKGHAKFYEVTYGKYAKDLADHFNNTGERLKNYIEEKDDYIIIYLYDKNENKYYEALIDKEDYNKVKEFHWNLRKENTNNYATTQTKGKQDSMHRKIMQVTDPKQIVDHRNGNGLDNRKENLNIVTKKQNSQNRNHKGSNNTSGVIGIHRTNDGVCDRFNATWKDKKTNKPRKKSFSVAKYGEEEAFRLACEYRQKMINENDYYLGDDE